MLLLILSVYLSPSQSQLGTSINGIWNDDFAYDKASYNGWKKISGTQTYLGNLIINGSNWNYHGPFTKYSSDDKDELTTMRRKFQCLKNSSTFFSASFAFCDVQYVTTEIKSPWKPGSLPGLHTASRLDKIEGPNPFNSQIYTATRTNNEKYTAGNYSKCDNRSEYLYIDSVIVSLGTKQAGEIFEIWFTTTVKQEWEGFALWYNITLICDPITSDPTMDPTTDPTTCPTTSPTFAPSEAPSAFSVPTPSPIFSDKEVFVRTDGCDNGYCSSSNDTCSELSSCQTIVYAWNCFNGEETDCSQQGYNGNGIFNLGEGIWQFPYNLNYDNNHIILKGQGPLSTTLNYIGNESIWIQCRWYKCHISMQNLTIASNRTSINDIQFYMSNGGTLYFKDVIFDGNNYIENENGSFWIFKELRVNIIFENCNFTNNNAIYEISNGANVNFINCTFNQNAVKFMIAHQSNLTIEKSTFSHNTTDTLFIINSSSTISITNTIFHINSDLELFGSMDISSIVYLMDSTIYNIYDGSVIDDIFGNRCIGSCPTKVPTEAPTQAPSEDSSPSNGVQIAFITITLSIIASK